MAAPGKVERLSEENVASASSVGPFKSDVIIVSGTTQINTILPMFGGFVYDLTHTLIPTDGTVALGNGGNILVGGTMPQNKATQITWSKSLQKWTVSISA